jgi:hypothetical protein
VRSESKRRGVFCTSDRAAESLFVEMTPATATPRAALNWLLANAEDCLPPGYELAFDVAFDVAAIRCRGVEWWTTASQPANGPVPGARPLWRFDVSEARSVTRARDLDADDEHGLGEEMLDVLAAHWRAGRVSDADHRRLLVLAERQAAALERYEERRAAAPAAAPRVELSDDERYAVLVLIRHVARVLYPLLADARARELMGVALRESEIHAEAEAVEAVWELARELAAWPETGEPPGRGSEPGVSS